MAKSFDCMEMKRRGAEAAGSDGMGAKNEK
jgi:hypothetical protein